MKFRAVLTFAAIFAVSLLVASCIVTSRDINVVISCDQFSEDNHLRNDFQLEIGDKIRVGLCSNQSTGFKWKYEMIGETVLREEDYDFEEPENDVLGEAGREVWTFEAITEGTTEIHMEYSRPWEGDEQEEWTYTMTVTVQ